MQLLNQLSCQLFSVEYHSCQVDVFNQPGGVALDSSGTLYIADYGNSRIRRGTETAKGVIRDQPAPAIAYRSL